MAEAKQYTSTVSLTSFPSADLSKSGPLFLREFKKRRDQRLEQIRNPEGEEEQARLCFGGPVENTLKSSTSFKTQDSDNDDPEPPKPGEFVWQERDRKVKKVRVENPDDPEQYVMVERIEEMRMTAPSQEPFRGATHVWKFKNRN